ncbi:hypothetical protein KVC47_06550 [Helicobacter pylori]|nr:hypothetical protein KVC47_06550 [Helicobacter pylori]
MKKLSGYQKIKAESKVKDRIIESLKRELDAKNLELDAANRVNKFKDQIIESKDETIGALKRETDTKDQLIDSLTEERYQDEEKERSKSCLRF